METSDVYFIASLEYAAFYNRTAGNGVGSYCLFKIITIKSPTACVRSRNSGAIMARLKREGRKSSVGEASRTNFLWHCGDGIDGGTALPHSAVSHVEPSEGRGGRGGARRGGGHCRAPVCVHVQAHTAKA